MGPGKADPVLDRLRAIEEDLVVLGDRLELLALADLLERLGALRLEILAVGLGIARREFVAACTQCDSALDEAADLVELVSCLGGR